MKTFIIAVSIILLLSVLFTGCNITNKVFNDSNGDPTKFELEPNPSWKYKKLDWSTHKATSVLPTPDWTWWGYALIDDDLSYYGYLGYTTFEDFDNYINELKDAGYTENCDVNETSSNIDWIADHTSNGYTVMLHYCAWCKYITVWSYHNGDELRSMYWED